MKFHLHLKFNFANQFCNKSHKYLFIESNVVARSSPQHLTYNISRYRFPLPNLDLVFFFISKYPPYLVFFSIQCAKLHDHKSKMPIYILFCDRFYSFPYVDITHANHNHNYCSALKKWAQKLGPHQPFEPMLKTGSGLRLFLTLIASHVSLLLF